MAAAEAMQAIAGQPVEMAVGDGARHLVTGPARDAGALPESMAAYHA